jgi:hypothetical protein
LIPMTAGERIVAFAQPGKPPANWFFVADRAPSVNAKYAPNLGRSLKPLGGAEPWQVGRRQVRPVA